MIEDVKNGCDVVSVCVALGSVTLDIPTFAALASLIWTVVRLGEWALKKYREWRAPDHGRMGRLRSNRIREIRTVNPRP